MEIPPADYKPNGAKEGIGPMVGIIIIVGLLAAGGIYFLVTQEILKHTNPSPAPAQVNS